MANIYIDKIVIDNLYFSGVNDFSSFPDDEEESDSVSPEEENKGVEVDTKIMAKAISMIEDVDIETVKKVLKGAARYMTSFAKVQASHDK